MTLESNICGWKDIVSFCVRNKTTQRLKRNGKHDEKNETWTRCNIMCLYILIKLKRLIFAVHHVTSCDRETLTSSGFPSRSFEILNSKREKQITLMYQYNCIIIIIIIIIKAILLNFTTSSKDIFIASIIWINIIIYSFS